MNRKPLLQMEPLSEHQTQCDFMNKVWNHVAVQPELAFLYAIPNGGFRGENIGRSMVKEGARSGIPDLHLPLPRGDYAALYIEMKAEKGKVSPLQSAWHRTLTRLGNYVVVCYDVQDAWEVLQEYLRLPPPASCNIPPCELYEMALAVLPDWAKRTRTEVEFMLASLSKAG